MLPAFSFVSTGQIQFGCGTAQRLPEMVSAWGQRPLVVCGGHPDRHRERWAELRAAGLELELLSVAGEPTTEDAERATQIGRAHRADVIVGIGGGSALDLAKATAGLLGSGGDPLDYLEVVGRGQALESALPWVAVPTTAGTGAEVTKNSVLTSRQHGVKVSLRSELLLAKVALIDPLLTLSVPQAVTASTGFDALTQVIEPYLSCQANPMTDALCREGIIRGARSLLPAFENGSDRDAREDLALTSLFGGLALANAKLGAVHGIAGPLGGMYEAPHGALCAALLPASLEVNRLALARRAPESQALRRLDDVARWVTGSVQASAQDGIVHLRALSQRMGIAGLRSFGVERSEFANIISAAQRSSSMKGNPLVLAEEELRSLLELSL